MGYKGRVKLPSHLHVVPDAPQPDDLAAQVRKRVKVMPKPASMLQCPRCGGRSFVETVTGVMTRGGRPFGGTKAHVCVMCLIRGERVVGE